MFRPEIPKISLKHVQRRRNELDSHRALLQRTLRDAADIDEVTDIFPALMATLHTPRKRRSRRAHLL
jgi:hypothetical protein